MPIIVVRNRRFKPCGRCGFVLGLRAFRRFTNRTGPKAGTSWLSSYCIDCNKIACKERYARTGSAKRKVQPCP